MDIIAQAQEIASNAPTRSPFRCLLTDMRYYARNMRRLDDAGKAMRNGDGANWTTAYAFWIKADDKMREKYGNSASYKMKKAIIRCYNIESMIV